jgi:uncharacterized OB-fold protein
VNGFRVERDDASAVFFNAAADGVLLIRRCPVCGTRYPPQQLRCADSDELEWTPSAGTGVLVSWAVDHAPPLDAALASPDGVTSVFGLVELDEGPWVQVPLVATEPTLLREGMALQVTFIRPGEGEPVPAFTAR